MGSLCEPSPTPDRRRRPYNRIPKRVLSILPGWAWPVLGKIVQLHPPEDFPRVADVGGGAGRMARALRALGYRVTMFEPWRPYRFVHGRRFVRGKWKKYRKPVRWPSLKGIRVRRRKFLVRDAKDFDLVVSVRPCQASRTVARAAKYRPVVITPCTERCAVWPGKSGKISDIKKCFRDLGVRARNDGRDVFWTGDSNDYDNRRTRP